MAFDRVLVAVDFGAASLAAARWVASQLAPRADVMLVHVLPELDAPPSVRPYLPSMLDVVSEVAPALQGGLRGLADLIGAGRTRVEMRTGGLADSLAAAADEFRADVICLGRTRSRRGGARFGATTAQRLLSRTRLPVLVVPAPRDAAPTRVLAALDARPESRAVARAAVRVARAGEAATLDALHVLEPRLRALVRAHRHAESPRGPAPRLRLAADEEDRREGLRLRDEAHLLGLTREWLDAQLSDADASPVVAHPHARFGDPGQEIVGFAYATGADFIAIGRGGDVGHGGGHPGERLPLGSTTRLVMWAAPCPVLVVSPEVAPGDAGPPPPRGTRRRQVAPRPDAARVLGRASVDRLPSTPAARDGWTGGGDAA